MQVLSVNVGLPREILWEGARVYTGIFKSPVNGPVRVDHSNLAGDAQADLTVHGGADKAIYGYPAEHYTYWKEQLPDEALEWGSFGENLTTEGLSETDLNIGDHVRAGSATLIVTLPRLPCYKLQAKFAREDMIKRFLASKRTGFYFRVLKTGEVRAGSEISIVHRDENRVSVMDLFQLYLGQTTERDLVRRAMEVDALPDRWKHRLSIRGE